MTTVRQKMTKDPVIMEGGSTLTEAAQMMRRHDIGDVLLETDGSYGIVTDRDIVVRALADGRSPDECTLGEIATTDLETVAADDDLDEVIREMAEDDIRRVPVMDAGEIVGILAIGDLAVMRDPESLLADISAAPGDN